MKMAGKRGGGVAGNFPECCCYVFGDFMGFATFLLYGPFGAETSSRCRAEGLELRRVPIAKEPLTPAAADCGADDGIGNPVSSL